ncbi:MAG: putative phage-associated protein [Planctomycetota bacterium]|nr:putative phage-associated protein [Planctomycetota bacterium]
MIPQDITARHVARYLLAVAHEHGSFLSNLKLQKLLYYSQGWHLGIYQAPLFPDKFEAWVHGPVIPALYHEFKKYSWRNIDEEVDKPTFPAEIVEFLEELTGEYLHLDAYQLERMTHRESPWLTARGDLPIDALSSTVIDEGLMREHFRARVSPGV